jgi:hypothetical protein
MPETPTDPFDRLDEASTGLTIRLRHDRHRELFGVTSPFSGATPARIIFGQGAIHVTFETQTVSD